MREDAPKDKETEEVASSIAAPTQPKEAPKESKGGMFGAPLPGLKVLDPKLLAQPSFQKIAQMQKENE